MKILITEKIHESGIKLLKKNGVEIELLYELKRPIEDAVKEADGIIVRVAKLHRELLEEGKKHKLKVIVKHGVGVDNIDLEAARELGIRVVNVADSLARARVTDAVAEHTLGLMLLLAKKFIKYDKAVRSGNWKMRYEAENIDLKGKALGIIGFGKIGRTVANLAQALGMQVLVYDPYAKNELPNIKHVELNALLQKADFLSVHCPLTKETWHLLGKNELEKMKRTAFIINTARGGIIDEKALCRLIRIGRLAGAALDTTEEEPLNPGNPILSCPNVIFTAHTAGLAKEAMQRISFLAAKQILQVLRGEVPKHVIV